MAGGVSGSARVQRDCEAVNRRLLFEGVGDDDEVLARVRLADEESEAPMQLIDATRDAQGALANAAIGGLHRRGDERAV